MAISKSAIAATVGLALVPFAGFSLLDAGNAEAVEDTYIRAFFAGDDTLGGHNWCHGTAGADRTMLSGFVAAWLDLDSAQNAKLGALVDVIFCWHPDLVTARVTRRSAACVTRRTGEADIWLWHETPRDLHQADDLAQLIRSYARCSWLGRLQTNGLNDNYPTEFAELPLCLRNNPLAIDFKRCIYNHTQKPMLMGWVAPEFSHWRVQTFDTPRRMTDLTRAGRPVCIRQCRAVRLPFLSAWACTAETPPGANRWLHDLHGRSAGASAATIPGVGDAAGRDHRRTCRPPAAPAPSCRSAYGHRWSEHAAMSTSPAPCARWHRSRPAPAISPPRPWSPRR